MYLLSVEILPFLSLQSEDSFLLFGFLELAEPLVGITLLFQEFLFDFVLLNVILLPNILDLLCLLLGKGGLCFSLRLSSLLKSSELLLGHPLFDFKLLPLLFKDFLFALARLSYLCFFGRPLLLVLHGLYLFLFF